MTLNFITAPLTLKISVLEPWERLPQEDGLWPSHPGWGKGGNKVAGSPGEASKGRGENWLCPDSHASSQLPLPGP